MKTPTKVALFAVALCVVVLAMRHGNRAMDAALPKDMPGNAHFLQSGYDVNSNEPQGNWVACRVDAEQGANFCRVTDQRGMVVFEGNYLPLNSSMPVPESEIQIKDISPSRLFIPGPTEGMSVPAIPLTNGTLLVPLADRDALNQRWHEDPAEYNQIMEAGK